MKKSSKGIFLIAFLFALVGSGILYIYLNGLETPKVTQIKTTNVVIAKIDIPARTVVSEDMLDIIKVPEQAVMGSPFQSVDDIVGKYTRETIYANQQIHPSALIENVSEELSLKIAGNHRAITINVNGSTGVSGLIKPGDFVDVIVFLPQVSEQNRIVRPDITKLLLQNIEVLAIDKNLYRDDPSVIANENVGEIASSFVTLSVPVMDVESLVLAKDIGSIDLALRPLDGDYLYVTEGTIWQKLLLNDMKKIIDMFPEYDVVGSTTSPVAEGEFKYEQYIYYTVNFGDTLKSISMKYYGTEDYYYLIQNVNKIADEDIILTGTGIKIPVLLERGDENDTGN